MLASFDNSVKIDLTPHPITDVMVILVGLIPQLIS